MTGHLSANTKLLLQKAIRTLLENDIYSLKNVLLAFAEPQERVNHARLYTDIDDIVSKYVSMDFGTMRLGALIERLLQLVKDHRLAITPDVNLLLSNGEHFRSDLYPIANRMLLTILAAALFIGAGLASDIYSIPQWFGLP